jgi:succinate-semialdehyde dehydrogenase/glutarate-semialdehyde dehydrogenase
MAIESRNPDTGELLATFEPAAPAEVELVLQRAITAFAQWKTVSFEERADLMRRIADRLEQEAEALGRLMTIEMGKSVVAGRDEALKCARGCRYYAQHAAQFLASEEVQTEARRSYVRYQPIGVILAIMPWNFPFWQVFRFGAPALMAGNVALLKHAPNVPQCALAAERIVREAGAPEGLFQALLIETDQVPALLGDARVAAVTLTGSERAGRDVAARAGQALKKSVLELGGSDPFIVMPSADLDRAVATAVKSRTINNGQSCIAAKRFILADPIADRFLDAFVPAMKSLKVGDPMDPSVDVGPLARADLRDTLAAQVEETIARGARVLAGGRRGAGSGYVYLPTVLIDIPKDSPAYRDELFGPVASVFRVSNIEAAIALANDTRFGLGASVWTNDPAEQVRFAESLDVGQVFVNAMVASDPRVPFGGVKSSGYGRELGLLGIREFVNSKTVWVDSGPS